MRSRVREFVRFFGICGLITVSCVGTKAYVRQNFLDQPPERVAVLPFVITYPYDTEGGAPPEEHQIGREIFRKTFYYAFTTYGYEDVKLDEVDEKLAAAWGPIERGTWRQASPRILGQTLGVDALIYGEIDRLIHMATPLYTETSLDARLRMVDATSGADLWHTRVKAAGRGGAFMKKGQVVDFLKDQARSRKPEIKFLRVSDVAARQALQKLPNPPLAVGSSPPAHMAASGTVRLAILPFEAKHEEWDNAAKSLRRYLSANLQESPFEVLELQRVNAALQTQGWTEGQPLPEALSLPHLAQSLGADAFLHGTVTNWGRTYLAVQSWVKAELALELLDALSGEVIWSEKKVNRRQAGLTKGPTGFQSIATGPVMGLLPSHLERVAVHLTRDMAEALTTSPAVLAYVAEVKR